MPSAPSLQAANPRRASNEVPATTRIRGIAAMLLGLALALGCSVALWSVLPDPSGGAEHDFAVAALLAGAAAVGTVFVVAGWQLLRQGGVDRRVGQIVIALLVLLGAFLYYAKGLFR